MLFMLLNSALLSGGARVKVGEKYYVNEVKDLKGKVLKLSDNTTLVFSDRGKFVNGTIVGSNTKIRNAHANCFGVTLSGSWDVTDISDEWFDKSRLADNTIIKNINGLQSDNIKQTLKIGRDYCLSLSKDFDTGLTISSNTKVLLKGVISIKGNSLERYNILSINRKKNIEIEGGEIRGDVGKHRYIDGSTSEWGFGVYLYRAQNIVITGLKSSFCTGDGFYISGPGSKIGDYSTASRDIHLKKCVVYENRREGISLVHVDGVLIEDCESINMGQTEYTAPSYGINIEPHKDKGARNVVIRRYKSVNTKAEMSFSSGGYHVENGIGNRENVVLEDCVMDKGVAIMSSAVRLINCKMSRVVIYPMVMPDEKVTFKNCTIAGDNGLYINGKKKVTADSKNIPSYTFDNCMIAPAVAYKYNPGMLWGTDLGNVSAVFKFVGCDIRLPQNEKSYNLIASGFHSSFRFENCRIHSEAYPLKTNGASFKGCSIDCQYVDGDQYAANGKSEFSNCTVRTYHSSKKVQNEKGLNILSNNRFVRAK